MKNFKRANVPQIIKNRPSGEVQLLLGFDYPTLQPDKLCNINPRLVLYKSLLESSDSYKLMVGGVVSNKAKMSDEKICNFVTQNDFWSVEQMGVTPARACRNCTNCNECKFISQSLTFKEQEELKLIKENLKYDKEGKIRSFKYPLTEDPLIISDTKPAATRILQSLENFLLKNNLQEEYSKQIEDFINREVIEKMTKEEIKENNVGYYVPHNFVLKESSTTPLRIVINSS